MTPGSEDAEGMRDVRDGAIVIGSGPNGLAAAIVLARAGVPVRVLEAQEQVGGAARHAQATVPGVIHDLGSAVHPLAIGSPAFRRWPLADDGLRWVHPPRPLAHPLPDAPAGRLERSLEATADGLGRDGDAWRFLTGPATEAWAGVSASVLGPVLRWPASPVAMARFGVRAATPATWTGATLRTPAGRALWAGLAAHASLPLRAPGTSAVGLLLAAAGQRVGWPFPEGGSGRLTEAMRRYLERLGGEVRTGVTVRHLDRLPPSHAVLCTVPPPAFRRLAEGRLPAGYDRALARFRPGEAIVKLDLAVDGGVPWLDPACRQAGTVHLGGRAERVAAAEAAVASGEIPERPYVLVAQPGCFDRSRCAGSVEPLWAYAHLPRARAHDAASVATLARRIEAQIEAEAPGTRARVVGRRVVGPRDLETENRNLAGGDITAGASTLWQLLARPVFRPLPYRTPLPGVYLAGASTPPGPGAHGMAGVWAARTALRDRFGIDVPIGRA
ncbi:MAG: NAD(P)/FAD-dependent oxidoreductase [Trueperaceae bacterium]